MICVSKLQLSFYHCLTTNSLYYSILNRLTASHCSQAFSAQTLLASGTREPSLLSPSFFGWFLLQLALLLKLALLLGLLASWQRSIRWACPRSFPFLVRQAPVGWCEAVRGLLWANRFLGVGPKPVKVPGHFPCSLSTHGSSSYLAPGAISAKLWPLQLCFSSVFGICCAWLILFPLPSWV